MAGTGCFAQVQDHFQVIAFPAYPFFIADVVEVSFLSVDQGQIAETKVFFAWRIDETDGMVGGLVHQDFPGGNIF